ncbi:hypothetical protein ACVQWL_001770 [Campylobacter jejuni]
MLSTPMFFLGLTFIVIGTGFFKTNASVTVGMLYYKTALQIKVI